MLMTSKVEKAGGVAALEQVEPAQPVVAPVQPMRVFRDRAYMSRTLVMPDGRGLDVRQGKVAALGDDQFKFLSDHPDLELTVG
jgi:hypothetical protein